MTESKFPSSADAKKAGWHSRRHETPEAAREAREKYQEGAGPNVRKGRRRQKSLRAYRTREIVYE